MACILVIVCIVAGSCSEQRPSGRENTLVIGEISAFESLNPLGTTDAHARDVYNLLFLMLLDEQADFLTFKPRLAESYEFSGDRTMLTFHLRDGVLWSDGMPVTAYDVETTFKYQIDPDVVWPGRHLKEHIDSVRAIDEHTVVYHFNHVYPYQLMDAIDGPILPKHWLDGIKPSGVPTAPIGEIPTNGPFRIHEWIKGQSLTLVPYEEYYEKGKPYIEKVIFKIIPDQATLMTQLRNGEIDCMEAIPPSEVEVLEQNHPELTIFNFPTRAYGYIGWNGARPPFDNPRVRRALTHAIDRTQIIENLYYGYAREATSPFVPLIWAFNPDIEPIPFDPQQAKELLAREGLADTDGDGWLDWKGERFEFEILTNHGNQTRMDIQVMVQEMLRKIGVKVNAATLEWTVFLDHYKAGDYDAVVQSWRVGTKADLAPIWSCEARREGGYNRVNYCNVLVDSLNAHACSLLDFEQARPFFYRAQEIIYEEQPYTFLYFGVALNAVHKRFGNASPDPIGTYHNLHEWKLGGE
jgi:peptide/nickel transport system substrate-binding protein